MKLTELGLNNPTAVSVGLLLVLLFGGVSLYGLPVQLTPELEKPGITITTNWRGATPEEVESEIVERQEETLKSIPGLTELKASARSGSAEVSLTFRVGIDIGRALIEVINALNRVSDYPEDADEPYIRSLGSDARPIAWFLLQTVEGNDTDIVSYYDYIEDVVKARIERVPGVARSDIYGGAERELRITFDPYRVADAGLLLSDISRYAAAGQNVSGGHTEVGRRGYSVRYAGRYSREDIGDMILSWRDDGSPVFLRDVATVEVLPADISSFVLSGGTQAIAVNAQREAGVNVIEIMKGLQEVVDELNGGVLQRSGLSMRQVYDETLYINSAIRLLIGNLALGIALASLVLWLFLRNIRAMVVIILAIPACLFAAFILLLVSGRTLNIISLAGLAFAVGMVIDSGIVVSENMDRLRARHPDEPLTKIGLQAAAEVWGALLASTLTTIIVFIPIVFLRSEAGQLFSDLAVSIAGAIAFSLLVSLFVVPSAMAWWAMRRSPSTGALSPFYDRISDGIMTITSTPWRRGSVIFLLVLLPLFLVWVFRPQLDYLPEGSRNLAFAFVQPPPGAGLEHLRDEMGQRVLNAIQPHATGQVEPAIEHYFFVGFDGGLFMGAVAQNPKQLPEVVGVLNRIFATFPDTLGFARRTSLFGDLRAGGRSVEMHLQGSDLPSLYETARAGFGMINSMIPGARVRPVPGLILAQPELRLEPDERRTAEAGWTRSEVASIVRALGDGLYAGDYFTGDKNMDIIVRRTPWATPEELANTPLVTPNLGIVPLSELARLQRTTGANQIQRINQKRTLTLQVTPPLDMPLSVLLERLKTEVEPALWDKLPDDGDILYVGAAENLRQAISDLGSSFVLAIIVLFLLMAVLFRSYLYSLLVILTLPLALVGGVLALAVLNVYTPQALDVLTMIGFIILLGLVVNNSILLVYRTREAEREGVSRHEAVGLAVRSRLRPIMMSTMTSVFGMLPLCLSPGEGSEIYRGLASVIVGGMLVNVFFILILVPAVLRIGEQRQPAPV